MAASLVQRHVGCLPGDGVGSNDQQHTDDVVHHFRGGSDALGGAGHAIALGKGGNHVCGHIGVGVVQQEHLLIADVQQGADPGDEHDDDGGQDAGDHHVAHLGHLACAVDLGGLVAGGGDGDDGGEEDDGVVAGALPDAGDLVDGPEEARLIQQAALGYLLGNEAQIAQQLGHNAHVGGQGALLDQHGHERSHDDGGHELGQVGQHLIHASCNIGLDFIEEKCQNDGHREAEAQTVEAQQEGIAHGPPEFRGFGGVGGVAHQQDLEVTEAREQLLRHRLDLVRDLEASQQLVHGEVAPEQEHQQHGDQHHIQPPVLGHGSCHMEPVVLLHVVAHRLFGIFAVNLIDFVIDQEVCCFCFHLNPP